MLDKYSIKVMFYGVFMVGLDGWKRTNMLGEIKKGLGGREVIVMGFVRETRDIGKLRFIILGDITGNAQVLLKGKEEIARFGDFTKESVIAVKGTVKENLEVVSGAEIVPSDIRLITKAETPLPIQVYGRTDALLDTRLDWRFLDIRKPKNALVFKIETTIEMAMREYWIKNGFLEIHSPKLMGAPSETGADLFPVVHFDRTAYLAQSPQFYKQMAMCAGLDRVFEIGPVFRAEPSNTTRHGTEYTSIDMEMSWIESHEDVMEFEERWLVHVMKRVKETHGEEIRKMYGVDVIVPKLPIPRISFNEAKNISNKAIGKTGADDDLTDEGERVVGETINRKDGSEFVFVKEYPWSKKPFYHMRKEDDPSVTKGYDLIFNGVEITTGSQREHRYEVLIHQAKEKGLSLESVKFYTDFFKYGVPPHGGFGFGLTRLIKQMLHMENIREATFAFRDMKRLFP